MLLIISANRPRLRWAAAGAPSVLPCAVLPVEDGDAISEAGDVCGEADVGGGVDGDEADGMARRIFLTVLSAPSLALRLSEGGEEVVLAVDASVAIVSMGESGVGVSCRS